MIGTIRDMKLVLNERGKKRVVVFIDVPDCTEKLVQRTFTLTKGDTLCFEETREKEYYRVTEIYEVKGGEK